MIYSSSLACEGMSGRTRSPVPKNRSCAQVHSPVSDPLPGGQDERERGGNLRACVCVFQVETPPGSLSRQGGGEKFGKIHLELCRN